MIGCIILLECHFKIITRLPGGITVHIRNILYTAHYYGGRCRIRSIYIFNYYCRSCIFINFNGINTCNIVSIICRFKSASTIIVLDHRSDRSFRQVIYFQLLFVSQCHSKGSISISCYRADSLISILCLESPVRQHFTIQCKRNIHSKFLVSRNCIICAKIMLNELAYYKIACASGSIHIVYITEFSGCQRNNSLCLSRIIVYGSNYIILKRSFCHSVRFTGSHACNIHGLGILK